MYFNFVLHPDDPTVVLLAPVKTEIAMDIGDIFDELFFDEAENIEVGGQCFVTPQGFLSPSGELYSLKVNASSLDVLEFNNSLKGSVVRRFLVDGDNVSNIEVYLVTPTSIEYLDEIMSERVDKDQGPVDFIELPSIQSLSEIY